jgi:hypothetical protein
MLEAGQGQFPGGYSTADYVLFFQDADIQAGFSQVGSDGKPVVSSADYYDFVFFH